MYFSPFLTRQDDTLSMPTHQYAKIWKSLLSPKPSWSHTKALDKKEIARSAFHKDYDRLIFSQSFRQLNQKTQVHPLTHQMGIHTRLTHSLEVSCIGRSLGMLSAEKLGKSLPNSVTIADVGVIVQAACLAHDIGNPPFGHAGEYAIRDWFFQPNQKPLLAKMTPAQQLDLLGYEGNAQGFRLLTRNEHHPDMGGMRLTAATLGAFMKYPWIAMSVNNPLNSPEKTTKTNLKNDNLTALTIKKYGCFISEANYLHDLGDQLGMVKDGDGFRRHPLAYLLEAADDICYALIDLEDGIMLGLVSYEQVEPLLIDLIGKQLGTPPEIKSDAPISQKLAALRGRAMKRLVDQVTDAFVDNQSALLHGELQGSLFEHCPATVRDNIHFAKRLARDKIFNHPNKVRMELMANHCLHTLLDAFMPLALVGTDTEAIARFEQQRLLTLLNAHLSQYNRQLTLDVYDNALCILDMITGMNDHEAYHLAQELKGNWSYRMS